MFSYQKYCRETFHDGQLVEFEGVYPENFNFAYDVIDAIAKDEPTRRAMLWCDKDGENARTFTFADIEKYSNKAANLFASKGIKRGDSVVLIMKRHYQFWFAIIALHKLGAVGIPATHLLTKKDLVYRFNAADVKAVLCTTDGDITEYIDAAQADSPTLDVKFSVKGARKGWIDFDTEIENQPDTFERVETAATDPMLLYFTSGTTGMPKMVWHDYSYPIAHIVTAKYWHNVDPDGLHLTLSDTGWMKAMWGKLYGQWFMKAGVFVVDFDKFTPAQLLTLFAKYNITTFCAPPTMFRFFIKEDLNKYDLSSLQHASIAGEALNPEVFKQFYDATGLKLMEGFGQTETTLTVFNQVGVEPKPGSMGKPSPGFKTDLVDENGKSVPTGTVGEIVVRTPNGKKPVGMFDCYYKDKERTESVWFNDIYHTGDTAWRDEDGYFWYVGRTDDIIKSSGYRIGPFEIESVLMEHPSVLECAITGVPDPIRGQVVKATIILANGYTESDDLAMELQTYVKKQTAPYKYPRVIEFVKELPKTISGKIKRAEIRDQK